MAKSTPVIERDTANATYQARGVVRSTTPQTVSVTNENSL